jgi:molybdopterin-guanine dinucleotide biosynthesis adapter protein
MKIVAIVGFSESGKTRLITRLIGEFKKRGLRTCAVKRCSHGFSLDTEGKDTSDFTKAGATGVAMVSTEGWAALGQLPVADVPVLAGRLFPDADVVLVEGGKESAGLPKIEVLRACVSKVLVSRPDELLAIVADFPLPAGLPVPIFKPEETAEICDKILSLEEATWPTSSS